LSEVEVKRVLEDWRWTLHGIPGVTAVGRASGSVGKIVIYVERLTREVLETIPPEIEGVPVEIRESGPITILQPPALPMSVEPMARTTRVRPLVGGISVGSVHITAGTLGGVAVDMATGTLVGLSNNHVLLASKWGDQRGYPNGEVVQPGVADGGRLPDDLVGYAHRGYPVLGDRDNPIDAAIFRPIVDVTPDVLGIEVRKVTAEPEVGMRVVKSGRTSGVTYGEVTCLDATVDVRGWGTARFVDQVLVEPAFMKPGDSGSLVFNAEDGSIVGLGFAGSDRVSVFNRATAVESLLDILILGAPAIGFRLPPGVGSLLVGLGLMALTI